MVSIFYFSVLHAQQYFFGIGKAGCSYYNDALLKDIM